MGFTMGENRPLVRVPESPREDIQLLQPARHVPAVTSQRLPSGLGEGPALPGPFQRAEGRDEKGPFRQVQGSACYPVAQDWRRLMQPRELKE